jgi:NitT/TauT family transport system ATP-binding protein
MAGSPKLVVSGLSKWFPTRGGRLTHVLQNVNLEVHEGEFVSIVGASGCGKTTFLRLVDGIIPADRGRVVLDGIQVDGPGPNRSIVFQHDSLYPWRTVEQNIWFGLELQRRPLGECRRAAGRLVDLVGLRGFERHYPHELSGGMRQRVNLARALAVAPQLLLMDEPFAALDAQTREVMQRELLKIWDEHRKTVLFITHQIDEAVYLSDRVAVFSVRPGTVRTIIPIELPRPRPLSVKRSPQFSAYVGQIWNLIEQEVVAAMTTT